MSLLDPGVGDYLDRLSILARKIVEGRDDLIPEYDGLINKVSLDGHKKLGNVLKMSAINAAIWQREDEIRRLKNQTASGVAENDWHTLGRVAVQIQELNDKRAALIAELNGTPSEKLYK